MPARDASPLPDPAARPRQARRPRSSTSERSALLRRDLMEGELYEKAAQLFAEKGFAGTTLQDIANAMGVSRPSLYHYIRSKDELLERLARQPWPSCPRSRATTRSPPRRSCTSPPVG